MSDRRIRGRDEAIILAKMRASSSRHGLVRDGDFRVEFRPVGVEGVSSRTFGHRLDAMECFASWRMRGAAHLVMSERCGGAWVPRSSLKVGVETRRRDLDDRRASFGRTRRR